MKYIAILIGVLCVYDLIFAQQISTNLRSKQFFSNSDTIQIDSLSIVPESFSLYINGAEKIADNQYFVDYAKSRIVINSNLRNKNLYIKYRVFPINFSQTYRHKDTSLILKNYKAVSEKLISANELQYTENKSSTNLKKSGSISRAITFGNNRDVATLSNLNLQLSGKINDEVSVLAAISDDNMPIQPDGNTQKLQEFDKIYVKLFKKNKGITLGDIEMRSPKGYFMKLQKRTRGVQLYSTSEIGKKRKSKIYSQLTAGVAKGKYKKLKIKGIEGNQGPYKLTGYNNETYIIIIAGSEKVYINGRLLKRGQNFDYVINYNMADLVFTANCIITKDDRITVEYEYTRQVYPNMQLMQNNYFTSKKVDAWLNFYFERDNKNDPLSETYTDDIKRKLAASSSDLGVVSAANVRRLNFEPNSIFYKKIDTICNGISYDSVYVYSRNPQEAIYRVGFSYVGQNRGNYVLDTGKANGKVYNWIAPKNNIPQGNYSPVNQFITPKRKLLTNIGANVETGRSGNVGFEFAMSNYDANTYSPHNTASTGYALKLTTQQRLINADTSNINLKFLADCKIINENFEAVENYNSVEFERDWNLNYRDFSPEEKSFSAGLLFSKRNLGTINFMSKYMLRATDYKARRNGLKSNLRFGKTQLISDISYLLSDNYREKAEYLKRKIDLLHHFKFFVLGASEASENNSINIKENDSISGNSFKFNEYKLFVRQADSAINKFDLSFTYRDDYLPITKISTARTWHFSYKFLKHKNFKSKSVLSYRNVDYLDTISNKSATDNYLSGRQEIFANFWKKSIRFSLFYENSSGLELKKQYQYVEVQAGQGQFTWIDYNSNKIKELDEFEPAKFSDQANYIRIFLPSNEYVRAYITKLRGSLIWQPYKLWSRQSGFRGFLAMFGNQFLFRISEKTPKANYFPNFFSVNNNLIYKLLYINNNLSFISKNTRWKLNYEYNKSSSKNLLTIGSEEQNLAKHTFLMRYKIFKRITVFNTAQIAENQLFSEHFVWKNYKLRIQSEKIELKVKAAKKLYTNFSYKFSKKRNAIGNELANINSFQISINQGIIGNSKLDSDCSLVLIKYSGEINQSVLYQMLDGLQNGRNLVWNISYSRKISKFFYLSIAYNGRTAENTKIIHNGSVQLRTYF